MERKRGAKDRPKARESALFILARRGEWNDVFRRGVFLIMCAGGCVRLADGSVRMGAVSAAHGNKPEPVQTIVLTEVDAVFAEIVFHLSHLHV